MKVIQFIHCKINSLNSAIRPYKATKLAMKRNAGADESIQVNKEAWKAAKEIVHRNAKRVHKHVKATTEDFRHDTVTPLVFGNELSRAYMRTQQQYLHAKEIYKNAPLEDLLLSTDRLMTTFDRFEAVEVEHQKAEQAANRLKAIEKIKMKFHNN